MRRNFIVSPVGFIPLPHPTELKKIAGEDPTRKFSHRIQLFGLVQDEWNFAPDWFLTVGGRIDFYSDKEIGDSYHERIFFSPRVALVHYLTPFWSWKILYNRAFHTPSFLERGFKVGSLGGGEVIDMLELTLEKQDLLGNSMGVSVFGYKLDNLLIERVTQTPGIAGFSSLDIRYGAGAEVWLTHHLRENLSVTTSYAFQRAVERQTGQVYGMAPTHMVFSEINWAFLPDWNANAQLKWVGERKRAPDDPRTPLRGYALLSLGLKKELLPGMSITFSVQNLLDAPAKEPSNNVALPGDVPLPGRSFIGILDASF
jgi:iron complex outermembrane receptor protein